MCVCLFFWGGTECILIEAMRLAIGLVLYTGHAVCLSRLGLANHYHCDYVNNSDGSDYVTFPAPMVLAQKKWWRSGGCSQSVIVV